jgi:hypothetical protein
MEYKKYKLRSIRVCITLAIVAIVTTSVFAGGAMAQSTITTHEEASSSDRPDDSATNTSQATGDSSTYSISKHVSNKQQYIRNHTTQDNSKEDTQDVIPPGGGGEDLEDDSDDRNNGGYICSCNAEDTKTQSVKGSYIRGHTHFELDRTGGHYVIDGHSTTSWKGESPFSADEVRIHSQVVANGIEPSISVPQGIGYRPTSNNVGTYSQTWQDTWYASHTYSGIEADAFAGITSIEQRDTFSYKFGNSGYSLSTHIEK